MILTSSLPFAFTGCGCSVEALMCLDFRVNIVGIMAISVWSSGFSGLGFTAPLVSCYRNLAPICFNDEKRNSKERVCMFFLESALLFL